MTNQTQFKTEYFQKHGWDTHSDPKLRAEELQRISHAEEIVEYLRSLGILYKDVNLYKFVYARMREKQRSYYLFVIRNDEVINVNWAIKRKDIGAKIQRYWGCNVVVWYPKQIIIPKHHTIHIRDGLPQKIRIPQPTDKLGHFRFYMQYQRAYLIGNPMKEDYWVMEPLFNSHQRVETYGKKD